MDEDKQREIASKGGHAAHEKGRAHEFDSEEARAAGRKGGETVSQDREHMAEIGRKGGETVSQDREHMAEIGRKGGETVSQDREHMAEIGRKGGESVSHDREYMSEIGRKGGEHSHGGTSEERSRRAGTRSYKGGDGPDEDEGRLHSRSAGSDRDSRGGNKSHKND